MADEIREILKNSPFLSQTLQDYARQSCEALGTHMAYEVIHLASPLIIGETYEDHLNEEAKWN